MKVWVTAHKETRVRVDSMNRVLYLNSVFIFISIRTHILGRGNYFKLHISTTLMPWPLQGLLLKGATTAFCVLKFLHCKLKLSHSNHNPSFMHSYALFIHLTGGLPLTLVYLLCEVSPCVQTILMYHISPSQSSHTQHQLPSHSSLIFHR